MLGMIWGRGLLDRCVSRFLVHAGVEAVVGRGHPSACPPASSCGAEQSSIVCSRTEGRGGDVIGEQGPCLPAPAARPLGRERVGDERRGGGW